MASSATSVSSDDDADDALVDDIESAGVVEGVDALLLLRASASLCERAARYSAAELVLIDDAERFLRPSMDAGLAIGDDGEGMAETG